MSLHYSNFSVNFGNLAIQYPKYFSIAPRYFHPKYEFYNLRSVKSLAPFIFSNCFTKFDLTLSSCRFSSYLSSVILQNNDDCQQLVGQKYSSDSKTELNSQMENFYTSSTSCINIDNCEFRDIIGDKYNGSPISAALRLITSNNGGTVSISNTQFHNCRSANLASENNIGGSLYICTKGDQHCYINLQNLVFSQCNSFDGAAFTINSECPINYTEISCRNINITDFINLPSTAYFDDPRNVVNIQNCLINQFANVLFDRMNSERFLMNIISFSNCDGKVSSLQFTDIKYLNIHGSDNPVIQVSQSDGFSHSLIFDGLGFKDVQDVVPIYLESDDNQNGNLNVVIDNLYYNGTNYLMTNGPVSASISIIYEETSGMNVITPSASVSESPTPSLTDTPYPTVSETPTPSVSETPYATPTETPAETPLATPSDTPIQSPVETPSESPLASPTRSPLATLSPATTSAQTDITDFQTTFEFSPSQNITDDNSTDDLNPPANNRSVKGKTDVGLIVGCTVAAIVLVVAIILIILFFCIRKVPCCGCCEKTAFEPSDEGSKTELCFFDETLNQAQ